MRYLMCDTSDISITYLVIVLPRVLKEFFCTVTVDDHVMRYTLCSSVNCKEIGFGDSDLHSVLSLKCLKNLNQFYFRWGI